MNAVRYPVVELRQYTLRPGQRDVLIPRPDRLDDHLRQIERSADWRDGVLPTLSALITGAPQQLRLAPTARSLLR